MHLCSALKEDNGNEDRDNDDEFLFKYDLFMKKEISYF